MNGDSNNPSPDGFTAVPPGDLPRAHFDAPRSEPLPLADVLAPTWASLRVEGGAPADGDRRVLVALTADALWMQDVWQLRQVPLANLADVELPEGGTELTLSLRPEVAADTLRLTFDSAAQGRRWLDAIQQQRQQLSADAPADQRFAPEGVALVVRAPDVPHVVVGRVQYLGESSRAADRGLQLRAGILGADAVIDVERHKCPEMVWGAREVRGVAVRVEDADARRRLRWRWFREEVGALVNRMLLLVVLLGALLLVSGALCVGATRFNVATGETTEEALVSTAWALGLAFA
jgi:hypothetical protein